MFEINVKKEIDAPITEVFELLVQHEKYSQFRAITHSLLIKKGEVESNGLGARRLIASHSFKVVEDIVGFKRPNHLGYKIIKSKPFNIEHKLGDIQLVSTKTNKTLVRWVSRGKVTTPLLGKYLDKKLTQNGHKVIHSILKDIETKLRS